MASSASSANETRQRTRRDTAPQGEGSSSARAIDLTISPPARAGDFAEAGFGRDGCEGQV